MATTNFQTNLRLQLLGNPFIMSLPSLVIHLFGPMRVHVQGEPLPRVRTRSVEWLLALLVLRHGRVVDRSWLAGTLWLDSEESQALRNLREDLVRLRKALGGEGARIQSPSRNTLTLDLEGAEVDLIGFDQAIQAGDEGSLRRAIALYTGLLLEGCYEDWVTQERESREQACVLALETLASWAEQRGDFSEALPLLRRAEGMDSLRDSIQRSLMRVLSASGDTPAALMAYREHRLRLRQEMNLEPDQETIRLFQQIREQARPVAKHKEEGTGADRDVSSFSLPPSAAVPHPITALIGRAEAVHEVVGQVAVCRLVTLAGTGGVGKTRLCIQAAHEAAEQFPQGAAFITLASLSDPALLPSFVASTLGMREEGSTDADALLQSLVGWLSVHELLLVLDNCEHLVEATANLCQTLLERCPHLHILATSRQRLGLTGEVVWRVPSLPTPDPQRLPADEARLLEELMQSPSVQLFVERARMVSSGFRLAGREDAEAVAHICQRLDGIPLAIELAAARAGVLTLSQIAVRLDDRFRLLTSGSRGVLTRHQTLRALIDWSYDLLTEAEQTLLLYLSVFVGGWTLKAAEQIFDVQGSIFDLKQPARENPKSRIENRDVLDMLTSLVDKSLVLAETEQGGLRYRMLETIREYALERLRESEEETAARNLHLSYCLHLAQEVGPALHGSDIEAALERVESEIGNFRAALAWAQTEVAPSDAYLRLAAALWPYWEMRGSLSEGREVLRVALNRSAASDGPERAQALLGAATLAFVQADLSTALTFGQESLTLFRRQNDPRNLAAVLILCGHACLESGIYPEAVSLLEEALECCRQCDWARGNALALTHLGLVAMRQGESEQAHSLLDQGISVAAAAGHAPTLALSLHNLGFLAQKTGDDAYATTLLERSLGIWRQLGHRHKTSLTLRHLGEIARQQGGLERALFYFEEAVAACREQGNRFHLAFVLLGAGSVHYEQGDYEPARQAYAETLELFTQIGNEWGINAARMTLGSALFHLGEPVRAQQLHREALAIYHRDQNLEGIVWSLERLSVLEAMHGEVGHAVRLLGAASTARERLERPRDRWDQEDWETAVASVRETLGKEALASLWAEGLAQTLDETVERALKSRLVEQITSVAADSP